MSGECVLLESTEYAHLYLGVDCSDHKPESQNLFQFMEKTQREDSQHKRKHTDSHDMMTQDEDASGTAGWQGHTDGLKDLRSLSISVLWALLYLTQLELGAQIAL